MSAPPVSFYADFQGLSSLKSDAKAQDPAALKEAAKQFESLFTQMLLKSMRDANKSFGEDSLFGSDQADFYQDMFDDQIAMQLSKGKGLGLAEMLIRQLTTQTGPHPNPPPATGGGEETSSVSSFSSPPPVAGGRAGGSESRDLTSRDSGERGHMDVPAGKAAHGRGLPGQGGGAPLATSKADFVRTMWPHAEKAAREIGVDPRALLAQAALETGWGRAVPCNGNGDCSFNLFGIKAGSQWPGATVSVPTLEFEDGVAVRKFERFRSYDSAADSFRDYAALIRNNSRYEDALGAGSDITAFASALQRGGYATDPNYARKVIAVAQELRALSGANPLKPDLDAPIAGNEGVRS